MAFVLDASVSAVWALADESALMADIAEKRLKSETALAPRIWWYEVRNLLIINERRRRITAADTAEFLNLLSSYPIRIDTVDDEQSIFRLARQYQLSIYDAAYLAVAQRNQLPLATLDRALEAAAIAAGVPLLA
jgi:predicted nucleic acid-binding protein